MSTDTTQLAELEASIRELQATARENPYPEQRKMLEDQVRNMQNAAEMLRRLVPATSENARPVLSPEARAFFTPEPPAPVPTWVSDGLTRADTHAEVLRCPPGARVYVSEDSIACAIPGQPGVSGSRAHGLTLRFHRDGRLHSQTYYDNGICRWAIGYHVTGGRETVGFWSGVEAKDYLEEGLHTRYAPNGVVVAQSQWRQGKEDGWRKLWEDDGTPICAVRSVAGRAVEEVYPDGRRNPL